MVLNNQQLKQILVELGPRKHLYQFNICFKFEFNTI